MNALDVILTDRACWFTLRLSMISIQRNTEGQKLFQLLAPATSAIKIV